MVRWFVFVLLAVAMVMAAAAPAAAETIIGVEYDTENQLWAWDLGFEHSFTSWLDFGARLKCYLEPQEPYSRRAGLIPAGVPYLQGYEIWAQIRYRAFSISFSEWCNHYLAQSGISAYYDTYGFTVRAELRI